MVGTPGRVLSHVQAGTINLQHCHTVVIDEVDVLLGDQHAFTAQVTPCCQALRPSYGAAWSCKVYVLALSCLWQAES